MTVDSSGVVRWAKPKEADPAGYLVQYAVGIGVGYRTLPTPFVNGKYQTTVPIDLSPNVMNFVRVGAFYGTGGVPVWSKPVGVMLSVTEDSKVRAVRRKIRKFVQQVRGS